MANTYENKYLDGVGLTHLWTKIKGQLNNKLTSVEFSTGYGSTLNDLYNAIIAALGFSSGTTVSAIVSLNGYLSGAWYIYLQPQGSGYSIKVFSFLRKSFFEQGGGYPGTNRLGDLDASLKPLALEEDTIKSLSINGKVITVTPGGGDPYTLTTQDTTYTNATTSKNGLMSSTDKIKLNDTSITPTLESQTIALGLISCIMDNIPSPTAANSAEGTFFNNLLDYISSNRSVNGIYVRFESYSTFLKLDFAELQTGLLQFSIMENVNNQANGYGVVYTTTDNLITFSKHSSNAVATTSTDGLMSSTDKTKLNGIASGAEVNVQSDWNATSGDAFIKNKPTIPTKSSWNYDDVYVKYNAAQSLTNTQKTQARSNIGAGTSNFSGNYNDLSNKPTVVNGNIVIGNANSALTDSGVSLTTLREIASGATNTYVAKNQEESFTLASSSITTQPAEGTKAIRVSGIKDTTGTTIDISKFKVGDVVLLTAVDEPDWFVATVGTGFITLAELETRKIDLEPYETKANAITGLSVSGKVITYTKGNGSTGTITTQDTTYNNATTSAAGLMSKDDKTKLNGITSGATKVEASTTNGKIKINGTETTVYTHPGSGTNPHGTTKSDVGLGNVGNFKAVSTVASQGLTNTEKSNARANIGAGTSNLTLGTTSTTAAKGDHTHTTSIAESSGTNQLNLEHGKKYALNAGGTSYIFTMPSDNNTHYSAYNYVGAKDTGSNAETTNGNTYLKLYENGTKRSQFLIKGNDATSVTSDADGNITISSQNSYQTPLYTTGLQISSASTGALANLYVPVATSTQYGVVKIGYTQTGKNYPVELSNGQMYVNVPWTDNNTTNTAGSSNDEAKLYLIGAKSQATSAQTYSDTEVYTQAGELNATSVCVAEHGQIKYDSTNQCIRFVIA